MTDPIRVLHFADTHVGVESYGKTDAATGLSSRVLDFLRRIDEMIAFAQENDVDLVVFAGDAFKTRSPNPTFQREFAYRVQDLADLAPVVMLVGNHDLPPNAVKASSIEIFHTLAVPNVWVAHDYELRVIETHRGPVAVGAAPYPIRSKLLADEPTSGMNIGEIDELMREKLAASLETLATKADELDMPRLLTGHFTVGGAVVGSERQIMLGRDISVSLSSLADPRWDYVALGHIHKHQNLTARKQYAPPVVYSGSLERIDFGEEGDPKGFCWVDLQRDNTTWDFVPVSARTFVTLRADLRKADNPTQELINKVRKLDLKDTVVRIIVDLTRETESRLNEPAVRDALRQAGVFSIASVRKDVEEPLRLRLGASPEGLTPMELLERYFASKQVPIARRQQLLQAAQSLFEVSS